MQVLPMLLYYWHTTDEWTNRYYQAYYHPATHMSDMYSRWCGVRWLQLSHICCQITVNVFPEKELYISSPKWNE